MSDLRLALRSLAKSPGYTALALITLALGIGLNTSMFSLMNLLLLQPLHYPETDRLIRLYRTTPQSQTANHSARDYFDLAESARDVATFAAFDQRSITIVAENQPPVALNGLRVSAEFFPVIGLPPYLGRFFRADEDRPDNHVVMLSHAAWQAQFGGDPSIVGRTVRVDGEPAVVVGIMPATFASVFLWGPGDAFRPLGLSPKEKASRIDADLRIVGRIRDGLSLDQVNARLLVVNRQLAPQRPPANQADGLHAVTLQSTTRIPTNVGMSWLLLGLSGFVLLIACSNLANLQLVRAAIRRREFAIRAALGASRARLIAPVLAESLTLALLGGACGVLVAAWCNAWIASRLSANGLVTFALELDWRVLGFAAAISLLTGVFFGLAPAWLTTRVRIGDTLKSGARGSTGDRAQHRFRHGLIVAQFALALVLLAGAGFFIRGVDRVLKRDHGWSTANIVQGVLSLPAKKYPGGERAHAFYLQLQEKLRALPAVEDVSVSWAIPMFRFNDTRPYVIEGRDAPPAGHEPLVAVNGITPSYLDTLKIKLVAGRNFTAADTLSSTPVALIDESMARAFFPNESPLGHRIGGPDPQKRGWMEIVGVISDQGFVANTAAPATRFQVMRPLAQETWHYVTVSVRSTAPTTAINPIRRAIAELDPDLPVQQLSTLDEAIARNTSGLGVVYTALLVFAVLGLFLAALGLYGTIARLVVQRTPEIGLRIALGAQGRDIAQLVLGSGFKLTLLGIAVGLLGAFGVNRILAAVLPEMAALELATLAAVTALLALVACWLPARRATRVDPMAALRAE